MSLTSRMEARLEQFKSLLVEAIQSTHISPYVAASIACELCQPEAHELPPNPRDAIHRALKRGCTYECIAACLNCSKTTISHAKALGTSVGSTAVDVLSEYGTKAVGSKLTPLPETPMTDVTSFSEAVQLFADKQTGSGRLALAKTLDYQSTHPMRFRLLKLRLCARYAVDRKALPGAGGKWTDFLDWLIANAPAIIELIMKIITMFGDEPVLKVGAPYGINWDGVTADAVIFWEQVQEIIENLKDVGLTIQQLIAHIQE